MAGLAGLGAVEERDRGPEQLAGGDRRRGGRRDVREAVGRDCRARDAVSGQHAEHGATVLVREPPVQNSKPRLVGELLQRLPLHLPHVLPAHVAGLVVRDAEHAAELELCPGLGIHSIIADGLIHVGRGPGRYN